MPSDAVDRLISGWLDGSETMHDALFNNSESVYEAVVILASRKSSAFQSAILAAGPLEILLAWHGAAFIERVEIQAARDPQFKHLLGGVWRCGMPPEIWERVCRARGVSWDG